MDIIIKSSGVLTINGKQFKCALGKGGVVLDKKEGDGATPVGCSPIRKVFYREDRIQKPKSVFESVPLRSNDGWCDAHHDPNYNKRVTLPYSGSAERLWREDKIYDLIVVLGYNDDPIISDKGSAIFMHLARQNYSPTEGCIALSLPDILEVLNLIDLDTKLCIEI